MDEKEFCQKVLVDFLVKKLPRSTLGQIAGWVIDKAKLEDPAADLAWQAIENWMED